MNSKEHQRKQLNLEIKFINYNKKMKKLQEVFHIIIKKKNKNSFLNMSQLFMN